MNDDPSASDLAETSQDRATNSSDSDDDEAGNDTAKQAEPDYDAGTIALSWSGSAEQQQFEYQAEHCYVGPDHVLVEGKGGPIDGSGESFVKIFTEPEELLHDGTGTYQAKGLVQFSWGGDEIVADGRQIHVGDYPQPASFTYQQSGSTIKYVVAWFRGSEDSGAGAVVVECNY